jgi:hypothetical protein
VLNYVKSLSSVININDLTSDDSANGLNELSNIMQDFDNIKKFFVTLDNDNYILTHIPGNLKNNSDDFLELINFEISQHDPTKTLDDFRIKTIPLQSTLKQKPTELVTMIDKNVVLAIESVVANLGYELTDVNPVPISALNTFTYNYPNSKENIVIIVRFTRNVMEFGILKNNKIIGYEFRAVEDNANIATDMENQIAEILAAYELSSHVDCIYFYGVALTKELYVDC